MRTLLGGPKYVTAGTTEKKSFLKENFHIPDNYIFFNRDLSLAQGTMRMTKGHGVDAALNSLSGEALRASWERLASVGTFVEMGRRDIDAHGRLNIEAFNRNMTFTSVNFAFIHEHNKELAADVFKEIMHLAREKKISPGTPLTIYPFSQLKDAFRLMQAEKHIGKIVLKPSKEDQVMVSLQNSPLSITEIIVFLTQN
jgi:NADPH:quinone reductase-like Zn-dependent oxidoreductase